MRIEIVDGDAGWSLVEPLEADVYPPEIMRDVLWRDVEWAHAARRVLAWDGYLLVCHVGIYERVGMHDGSPARIAGIGGVMTRNGYRRRGFARAAMERAAGYMRGAVGADFGLLFCEQHNDRFYEGLGWTKFEGTTLAEQKGAATPFTIMGTQILKLKMHPRSGTIDLCGLPW
jgi:aminoglycoside 2'-N-acetyltransferase I